MSVQPNISESGQIAEQTAPGLSGASHTPTPWSLAKSGRLIIREVPDIADGYDHYNVAVLSHHSLVRLEESLANAAFIVRAVNSHDALVKALEFAMEVTDEDMATGRFSMTERGKLAYEKARAALASAREVQP